MKARHSLPHPIDSPRSAFLNGWWAGIGVGFVTGLAVAVMAVTSIARHT